jgi:hypothetical protein
MSMRNAAPWAQLATFCLAVMLVLSGCSDGGGGDSTEPPIEDACTEGFLGCECIAGTACFPGSSWICVDGVCKTPDCTTGDEGCGCYANNTCNVDGDGDPMACVEGVCQIRICESGTLGCGCGDGGFCADSLRCSDLDGRLRCVQG